MAAFWVVMTWCHTQLAPVNLQSVGLSIALSDSLGSSRSVVIDVHAGNVSVKDHDADTRLMRNVHIEARLLIRISRLRVGSVKHLIQVRQVHPDPNRSNAIETNWPRVKGSCTECGCEQTDGDQKGRAGHGGILVQDLGAHRF
jgi:hypothetical protein